METLVIFLACLAVFAVVIQFLFEVVVPLIVFCFIFNSIGGFEYLRVMFSHLKERFNNK